MTWRRIWRLVKKELLQTRRDRRMLGILFVAPLMQLLIFGYAVTTDITHITTAVYDEDRTATSRAFIDRFIQSGYFDYRAYLPGSRAMNEELDSGRAQLVLHIPRGFATDLARGRTVQVQALYDGSDSMSARVVSGYTDAIVRQYAGQVLLERRERLRASLGRVPGLDGRVRVWYNPELKSVNFMVPGVLCLILLLITMMLTSLAIVKEKEIGTLEQLNVTPISAAELMLGKTLPFLFIGIIDTVVVVLFAVLWFKVPIAGSPWLLLPLSALFLLTTLGLGIFISTISKTQQEAMMTSFFFLLPFILLSGFMFPVENMPHAIQWVTYLIPLRYFLEIIRGIFLKGIGLDLLWPQVVILALFGVGIIGASALRFRKRMG